MFVQDVFLYLIVTRYKLTVQTAYKVADAFIDLVILVASRHTVYTKNCLKGAQV
jgi:hypothetical protein